MAESELRNPIGEEGEGWSTDITKRYYQYDPAVSATTTLTTGMVVAITGGYSAGSDQTSVTLTNYPVIRKTTTTPANNFPVIGVVGEAPAAGWVPGQIVPVITSGITQVLCDANNTTFGKFLILGSTTAGAATAANTATESETVAVCLQTATISSGTALVFGYIRVI